VDFEQRYRVDGNGFRLADRDPAETDGLDKQRARELRARDLEELGDFQERLFAERRRALLIVLQGMDASGKDGVVAHVMSGVNPQGVRVTAFKPPNSLELAHDWLWRHVLALPERGQLGIFNRSHYEEVVAVRVHPDLLAAEAVEPARARDNAFWERRFEAIAAWERHLVSCGTRVVKFFLHVSEAEQRKRLLARATDPKKQWKFSPQDVAERSHWNAFQAAYEAALRATCTGEAPWYAVPADHKWLARTAIARIVVGHLRDMDPRFPEPDDETRRAAAEAANALRAEGGGGAAGKDAQADPQK
jgi:PPK2 family polyphosphate:nucleotide phosphotransferase